MPGANHLLDNAFKQAIDKESTFRDNIKDNHAYALAYASRLVDVETALNKLAKENEGVVSEETLKTFMGKQRQRLLDTAEKNVQNEQIVNCFVASAKQLRQQEAAASAAAASQQQQGEESQDIDTTKDYEAILKDMMEKESAQNQPAAAAAAGGATTTDQENKYLREIQTELGIEQDNADSAMGDDDDDFVMMNNTLASQSHNLKCPITGSLLENPVKNKVCKHIYSRAGILQHIQSMARNGRSCQCPVPGCTNNNVKEDQLEQDVYMETMTRREKRRLDNEAQQRASQASQIDDSDDE